MTPLADDLRSALAEMRWAIDACDKLNALNPTWPISQESLRRWEAALLHGRGGEAVDKGPWRWEYDRNKTEEARTRGNGAYELQSEDFARDVRIEVSGDFADHADVERYMRWMQATLNASTTPPPQARGDMVLDVIWRIDNEAEQFIPAEGMKYLRYLRDLLTAAPGEGSGEAGPKYSYGPTKDSPVLADFTDDPGYASTTPPPASQSAPSDGSGELHAALCFLGELETVGNARAAEISRGLRRLATAGQGVEWQPIETAPKDGSRMLLWGRYWSDEQGWMREPMYGQWVEHLHRWEVHFRGSFGIRPTCWAPLPAAPTPEQR